jgi:hypothetical protein
MQPDMRPGLQPFPDSSVVEREPLTEFAAITASPKHFSQVSREEEQQADGPNQIVKEPNHLDFRFLIFDFRLTEATLAETKSTSVAP